MVKTTSRRMVDFTRKQCTRCHGEEYLWTRSWASICLKGGYHGKHGMVKNISGHILCGLLVALDFASPHGSMVKNISGHALGLSALPRVEMVSAESDMHGADCLRTRAPSQELLWCRLPIVKRSDVQESSARGVMVKNISGRGFLRSQQSRAWKKARPEIFFAMPPATHL